MEYQSEPIDIAPNKSSGLLGGLQGLDGIDGETICRSTDFIVRHVLTPAVEASIYAFFKNCTPESERIISNQWSLCTPEHGFNCDDVYTYTHQCEAKRESCGYSTTTKPGTMEQLMDDGTGVLLLVGLVLIGVLLGVASTIAICLMCPQTHRWANSKLRHTAESERKARESAASDYYTAIDERHNIVTLQLRPVKTTSSDSSDTCQQFHQSTPRDFKDPTYSDSNVRSIARAICSQHSEDQPSGSGESSYAPRETYEPLSRNDSHNQSHNYSHIDWKTPCSPNSEHSYFVLEKST